MCRRIAAFLLSVALVAVIVPGLQAGTTPQEVDEDNSLASDLVTPHKDWATGYAGGKIRALFFLYTGPYDGTWEDTGTRVREAVELLQRFDIDGEAVLFCGRDENWAFHGLALGEERAERLLEKRYDLYVIGGFPFERLPAKMQYDILKQVAEGAGLLCCGPPAKDFMVDRRRLTPTPEALVKGIPPLDGKLPAEYVSAYQLGKGRGVWLNYSAYALTPSHPFTWRGLTEYDYWMLLVGRAALWAASCDGEISVVSVLAPEGVHVARGVGQPIGDIVLSTRAQQAREVTVELSLRGAQDGLNIPLGETKITLDPNQPLRLPVQLPVLCTGDYFVDVVVRSGRGVEACGAGLLTVESDFGIAEVTLDRTFIEQGETIHGTVLLRGPVPGLASLRVDLRDSYGRVLRRMDLRLETGRKEYRFEYTADPFATILMRATATLSLDGKEVETKEAEFTVPKRRHGRHNFVMWDAPRDVLGYYAVRKLREAGQDVFLLGSFSKSTQPPTLRALDASLVPYSTRILDPKDENGYMQPCCWNDEPAVTKHIQQIVDNQSALREQGVYVYSLGDEGVTLGCCVHPACIAAYRQYLAAQYKTIEALNASWGTEYASFDEVDLLDHKDNMEVAAAKTCFPRWFDRQAFARYNLMQFSRRFVEAYKVLDPQAITGFEGTGGFGDDYDLILNINGFYGPYPSIGDDIIRSAAPRSLVRSNWMGYSKTGDALSDAAWRMVMKGMSSIWYWMWSGIGNWRGYLRPTLDYWPMIEDLMAEMRPVRQGLGDLLLNVDMLHSGIAILYSVPSALSHRLEGGGQFINPHTTHSTWTQLTYDLGLDFRYLTTKMLMDGQLDTSEFKVLLLPMTQALSAAEAAAIRRFAENGGTVIADVRPGIYDGHCKPLMPGALDDLFGIERTGRGAGVESSLSLDVTLEDQTLEADLGKVRVDPDVRATIAQSLAQLPLGDQETPVLLINKVGRGRAILLNFQLPTADPREPSAVAGRKLLAWLYRLSDTAAPITVTAPDGGPLPLTETRVWRTGAALVFGLWRHMENVWFSPKSGTQAGEPVPVRVTLPTPQHVYDLRAQRYLGRVTEINTRLRWGRATFYLALPYRIGPLKVNLSPRRPQAGEAITARLRLDVPDQTKETFAVYVEVLDPDGQEQLWGRQVVLLNGGRGEAQIARAYNDQTGLWRIRATELFSNQTAEARWTVP
ncbi:MAG: beta-galactosidase trimerization domain-containing protein [Candidatus Zipacnadales bacterium]